MKITIHQPEHLPWLGFFHKAQMADTLVLLDNVAFEESYYQNRNRIKYREQSIWVTVPVLTKHRHGQWIMDVEIDQTQVRWRQKYCKSLVWCYEKSPYWIPYGPEIESIIMGSEWKNLCDLNMELLRYLMNQLSIECEMIQASGLNVQRKGIDLILDIVKSLEATTYISGVSGIAGRGKEPQTRFHELGVEVCYQEFYHPIYPQSGSFIPYLSAVDLLFNCGPESLNRLDGKIGQKMDSVLT